MVVLYDYINSAINTFCCRIYISRRRGGALSKDDKKKAEIAKDVSAFANSDGGIILYGIEEQEHKAHALS